MIKTIIGRRGSGKTKLADRLITYRDRPCIIVDLVDQFKAYPVFYSAAALLEHARAHGLNISRPLRVAIHDREQFDAVCMICRLHKNILLVVDEVDFFDAPSSSSREFKKVIHLGRHYGIDLITTSRRPANISRDLTSQTDEFYIFRVTEKRDLDYFSDLSAELPPQITVLKKYHHVKYDHEEIKIIPPFKL